MGGMDNLGIFSAEALWACKIKKILFQNVIAFNFILQVSDLWEKVLCATPALSLKYIGDLDDWDMPEHTASFRKSGSTFSKSIK